MPQLQRAAHGRRILNPTTTGYYDRNNRKPDERFKADILVVVAHPDDEIMTAAYAARAIDAGKRVAIVWTRRDDGGTNSVGPEQLSRACELGVDAVSLR